MTSSIRPPTNACSSRPLSTRLPAHLLVRRTSQPTPDTMDTPARRVVQMSDWAPAQEAMFGAQSSSSTAAPSASTPAHSQDNLCTTTTTTTTPVSTESRIRSMSMSLPWRPRPKSALFDDADADRNPLALERSKSHGHSFNNSGTANQGAVAPEPVVHNKHEGPRKLKGILRRASVSLRSGVKELMHRRTSVPAGSTFDEHGYQQRPRFLAVHAHHPSSHASASQSSSSAASQRPSTAHLTWHRLRQAASFHRQSRLLHSGHGDGPFDDDYPGIIESPTFPIPGSGEQPPIIPRSTGAAARQAAANACQGLQLQGYEYMNSPMTPRPGWLSEDGPADHESGIGIALTSSEMDIYVPAADIDSDVDIGATSGDDETDIVKVDFISQLPAELAIQVLAQLDAAQLATASRVSRHWHNVIDCQHIWRESFMREKTATYATSGNVKPGSGLGVPPIRPENDWKAIYRVKEELDKRWKEGKARPVYLNGHTDSIYCLQFDETKIITGSRDRTIRVWDLHTYACKLVIGPPQVLDDGAFPILYDEHLNPVHYATLPGLGSSVTADGQPRSPVKAFHSTPVLLSPPIHHNASILCLQYDDRILVTGSSDSTCIVYDIKDNYRPIRCLRHHSAAVLDLVFDEKHIVTCSKDISICVWDRHTGALLKQLRGHHGPVNAVQMRGNTIVSCSGDFRVKLWNIDTGRNIREFLGHNKGLACSQFTEDGRYVASAGNDKTIRIWDANTGECVREMKAHENLVRSLHVDSISGRLVSASYDSDIKVWDMETGMPLLDFPKWHNSWVLSAKSDYRRIVSSGQDPKILVLDFGDGIEGVEMLGSEELSGEAVEGRRIKMGELGKLGEGGYI